MTSSRDVVEYEESAIGIPIFAAALDVAISPSGCASRCMAEGLRPQGKLALYPNKVALVSMLETFRRMRGRIRYLSKAATFSRSLYEVLSHKSVHGKNRVSTNVIISIAPPL